MTADQFRLGGATRQTLELFLYEQFLVLRVECESESATMHTKWMTLTEVAADRDLTLAEAQKLVDESNCPKAFKTTGTVYLI